MAVTLDTLKKTVGKKKVKSMAFAWLADYENMAGDVDNALARVEAGLKTYPGDIPGMLVRSKILFQKGDFEECIKECERVLEKEPFCLSAQKRMGEAYEQLENTVERNHCFRRVHDMDPLDTFWKEEYEAEPEENVAVAAGAVAGAAADAIGDVDFAMPDLGDMNQPQAEENAELALDTVTAEPAAEPQAEEKPAEEDNLFSKSLDMDIDAPAEETAPAKSASPFSSLGEDEDPFAALASLGGEDNSVEESAMDSLQQSLDSAIAEAGNETVDQEIPAGEEISGNDVGSAFADLFGEEDDLDSFGETTSAPAAKPAEPAKIMRPIMEGISEILRRNAEQMEQIAGAMEAQKDRLDRLERETMLKMPLQGKRAQYIQEAMRNRAAELMEKRGIDDAAARRKLAGAIRKGILAQWGAAKVCELPDIEYGAIMQQVATWMDARAIQAAVQDARARAGEE